MMRTTTYRYQVVQTRRTKVGTCPTCGKRTTRSKTFENTVNPFNKNSSGAVRSYEEVVENVRALADAWVPDFRHNTEACSPG